MDGLRIDTVPYVHPAFWQQFEASAGCYAVGEVDDGDIAFVSPWQVMPCATYRHRAAK